MVEELLRSESAESQWQVLFRDQYFVGMKVPTTIGQDQPLSPPQGFPTTSGDVDTLNARDALEPITDELFKKPLWWMLLWWILEILPTSYTFQNTQGEWVTTYE